MSKYTTEVRYLCEVAIGLRSSKGADDVDSIIEKACPVIFNFDFPIYDESYRTVLEKKILKHYYTREIGEETPGLWKLRLNTRLNEIMPYYNKMYESETYNFNPLYNRSLERKTSNEGNVDSTARGTNTGNTTEKYSDTPQGSISNLRNETYLTNATITDNSTSGTSNSQIKSTDEYVEYVSGYEGASGSKLIKEYREILINIDMMIINELEDLFFQLW